MNSKGIRRTILSFYSKSKNLYSILGIQRNAEVLEIKKAYLRLAREFHPDRNPNPEAKEKFTEVSEAYQTLSDDMKRAAYDSSFFGTEDRKQQKTSGYRGARNVEGFEDFFGSGRNESDEDKPQEEIKKKKSVRGADVFVTLELDFLESIVGPVKELSFKVSGICDTCHGTKCRPGSTPSRCGSCGGRGTNFLHQGKMSMQVGCRECSGVGVTIKNPCVVCRGIGTSQRLAREQISVPRGVEHGQSLRITGKGNVSETGTHKGDLVVRFSVRPDKYFRRSNFDVITDLKLAPWQAVLGDEVEVKTLTGVRKVLVLPGTGVGSKIKLPGEGIYKSSLSDRDRGDHFINLSVVLPMKLSPEEKRIFERLRQLD